ncbi:MAG: hypothetical protein IJ154_06300 [Bacteroidales bacterium]|nr:hypothetical protein [Bacteroidales bacterium]
MNAKLLITWSAHSCFRFLPALLTAFLLLCSAGSLSAAGSYRHYLPGGSVMVETVPQGAGSGTGAGSGSSTIGTKVLYYGYQDHLGSLTALVRERINGNGSISRTVADYRTYDAWGRLRDNDDWSLPRTDAMCWGAVIGGVGYTAGIAFSDGGFNNWNWGKFGKNVGIGAISGITTAGIGHLFGAVGSMGINLP